jgi:hypothetical protein
VILKRGHEMLAKQLKKLAGKVGEHDIELQRVVMTFRATLEPPPVRPKRAIGFATNHPLNLSRHSGEQK